MFSYKKKVSKKKKNDMPAGPAATHDCVNTPRGKTNQKKYYLSITILFRSEQFT